MSAARRLRVSAKCPPHALTLALDRNDLPPGSKAGVESDPWRRWSASLVEEGGSWTSAAVAPRTDLSIRCGLYRIGCRERSREFRALRGANCVLAITHLGHAAGGVAERLLQRHVAGDRARHLRAGRAGEVDVCVREDLELTYLLKLHFFNVWS